MQHKKIKYTGQTLFIGIDVHKNSWTITIVFAGIILKTFSMNPYPSELIRHLKRNYPGAEYKTVYEAGYCGYWIDRELRKGGIENIIVNPADVPTTHKQNKRKTDKIDSKKLARELSVGHLEGIYIPSKESEAIRSFSRLRIQLTKEQTRIKNRIKSLLDFSGIDIPSNNETTHWSGQFIKYLSEVKFGEKEKKLTLNYLLDNLRYLREQIVKVLKELRNLVGEDPKSKKIMGHLQSVPGIGFKIAITLYTEIMDIKRFDKFDKLSAFTGLVPDTDSSGQTEKTTGMTMRQQAYIKTLLIEAAWIAIKKDPALTMAFGELTKRMNKQRAIIRIAKKLLSRIMYVWSNEEDYTYSVAA